MLPPETRAASFVPSLEDVKLYHFFVLPTEVSSVQVAPELVDFQIFPFFITAASLVLLSEEAMLATFSNRTPNQFQSCST